MQNVYQLIGTEGESVVGCTLCGEVAHLQPNERHRCGAHSATMEILQPARVVNAIPDNFPAK